MRATSKISIRLEKRVRFEGDPEPPFWQADVWTDGKDYHAVGATPEEALLELALFWKRRTSSALKHGPSTSPTENEAGAGT